MRAKYSCSYIIGAPMEEGWCGASGPLAVDDVAWADGNFSLECPSCGRVLQQRFRQVREYTGNDEEVGKIMKMNFDELFDYVMAMPEYLTDHYYNVFGSAIGNRHAQLKKERQEVSVGS